MSGRLVTVAGRPHSGTTWLARILAEICGGATPVGGGRKYISSDWRVVRTHGEPGKQVWIAVLTKRDPRDVIVSVHHRHPHQAMAQIVDDVCGTWSVMLDRWREIKPIETSYEVLREYGIDEAVRLARAVFDITLSEVCAVACLNAYRPPRGPRQVGAWKNDLAPEWAHIVSARLGDRLEREGYER